MMRDIFRRQVQLLLRCLPALKKVKCFVLKGGTAINLFLKDMPRLSVDIDLTYFPVTSREEALTDIQENLKKLAEIIEILCPRATVRYQYSQDKLLLKLIVSEDKTTIKIEPNFILRGTLYPTENRTLCAAVQEEFGMFLDDVTVLNRNEIYAGKFCAALSRQHPRDLFDVHLLLANEGISDELLEAFVIYLASNPRPIHELLQPNLKDIQLSYNGELASMMNTIVTLDELITARNDLILQIHKKLTDKQRQFLISLKTGEPDWALMSIPNLETLPALQWKLQNIKKMDTKKREKMLANLGAVLER